MKKFNRFTTLALKAAQEGGEVLRSFSNRSLKVDYKGAIDPVTEADRTSQKKIRTLIEGEFPSHSIIGEEDDNPVSCKEYCWIIDPLDGTVNFIHHIPLFCVSVALLHKGRVVSGVVHAPLLNETFVAERGKWAWCNGQRMKVSSVGKLLRSVAITGFPYSVHQDVRDLADSFTRVLTSVQGVRRFGSAAIDLAYVAAGRCEAFWEEELHPWDVAAGVLLVEEAGGRVTDFSGGSDYIFGDSILASNGHVHRDVLKLLKKGKTKLRRKK